jgi:hypothetical protein
MAKSYENAGDKIGSEIKAYQAKMFKKEPEEIYRQSINNIFMEGTAYYTKQLANADDALAKFVLADGKTLEECANHVMSKARSVCGGMGADLPTEQFHEFIWEYYKMPVTVAKTAITDAKKRREEQNAANLAKAREKQAQAKTAVEKKKADEPKQLSFMDMMAAAEK